MLKRFDASITRRDDMPFERGTAWSGLLISHAWLWMNYERHLPVRHAKATGEHRQILADLRQHLPHPGSPAAASATRADCSLPGPP